jgi:hypothetical protein
VNDVGEMALDTAIPPCGAVITRTVVDVVTALTSMPTAPSVHVGVAVEIQIARVEVIVTVSPLIRAVGKPILNVTASGTLPSTRLPVMATGTLLAHTRGALTTVV